MYSRSLRKFWLSFIFVFMTAVLSVCSYALAEDFTAEIIGNYTDVTVMAVEGNYDTPTLSCPECDIPRKVIANKFFMRPILITMIL